MSRRKRPIDPYRVSAVPFREPTPNVPLTDSERGRLLGYLQHRISQEHKNAAVLLLLLAAAFVLVAYLGRSNPFLVVVGALFAVAFVLMAVLSPSTRAKNLRQFETFRAHPEQATEIELKPIRGRRVLFRYTRTWLLSIRGTEGMIVFLDVGNDGRWLWPLLTRHCPTAIHINHQDVT